MAPSTEKYWLKRGLLAAFVLALALPILATLAVAVFVDGDEVTAWLQPKLSGALNRPVTLGDATVVILPRPGIRLTDVRVGGGEGSETPSIITVDDVHLQAAVLPLFVGQVHTRHMRLDGLDVHLAITERGVSNFGDLVPESSVVEVPRDGPVRFRIGEVEIDDATLTYFDGLKNRSFAVAGASGRLELGGEPDGRWVARVVGEADSLHVRLPDVADEVVRTDAPSLDITARGDGSFEWIEIETGTLSQWGEAVAIRGRIEAISDVDPRLDLRFENRSMELSPFVRLVPPAVRARRVPALEGEVDLRLSLRGSLRQEGSPTLTGSVGLVGAGLRLGGDPVVTDVTGRVGVRPTVFALDSIIGTFADGPFLVDGSVDRIAERIALSVVASPELEAFERLGLAPYGSRLAGDADLVVQLEGPLQSPDSLLIDGTIRASGVQAEHAEIGVPVYAPSVTLEVDKSEVRWSALDVLFGTEPATTTGRLSGWLAAALGGEGTPTLEASFAGETIDLGAVMPPPESRPEVTYARIALAHLGGREVDGRRPNELVGLADYRRPRALPVHGGVDVELGRLRYGAHELTDLTARVTLSDSAISVEGAEFRSWDGAFEADLLVGVGERLDEPFAVRLLARDAEALGTLLQLTPVGESITGRLDLDLTVEGSLDRALMPVSASLRGGGTLVVREGEVTGTGVNLALADFLAEERWRSVPFKAWTTELVIDQGILGITRSVLEGDRASATLSGAVGLGGAVDLAMALSIPAAELEAVSLRRTGVAQSVLDRLRDTDSSLDLGIRISGTLQGPTLEPDALAASERIAARGK